MPSQELHAKDAVAMLWLESYPFFYALECVHASNFAEGLPLSH